MIDVILIVSEITKGMKSVGSKSLLKVSSEITLVEHQINQIKSIDKNLKITVITGFDHEKISKLIKKKYKNINILYDKDYETNNQSASLNLFFQHHPKADKLLIVNSGILFKHSSILSDTLCGNSKIYLLDKPKNNFTIGCDDSQNLEYIFYDLPQPWSECLYLNKEAIDRIRKMILSSKIEQMYIFEIINSLLLNNIIFDKIYIKKSNIVKINGIKDIPRIKNFV